MEAGEGFLSEAMASSLLIRMKPDNRLRGWSTVILLVVVTAVECFGRFGVRFGRSLQILKQCLK